MTSAGHHSLMDRSGSSARYTNIYVDKNATGANNGTSWKDAFTTIQAGLNACATPSTGYPYRVLIGEGTYTISTTLKPYKDTTICGLGRDVTIIDGNNSVRGFDCYANSGSNCNFEHLTIQNCTTRVQAISGEEYYSRCGAAIFGWGNGYWYLQTNGTNDNDRMGGYIYDCRFYNTNASYTNNTSVGGCISSFKWVVNCIFDNTRCFNSPGKCMRYIGCVFKNISILHNCFNFGLHSKNNAIPDVNDSLYINCTMFNGNSTSNNSLFSTGEGGAHPFNVLIFNCGTKKIDNSQSNVAFVNCIADSNITYAYGSNPKPTVVADVGTVSSTDPHLVTDSPCIGTGTLNLFGLLDDCPVDWTVDLDGKKRIHNNTIDVGAYAY